MPGTAGTVICAVTTDRRYKRRTIASCSLAGLTDLAAGSLHETLVHDPTPIPPAPECYNATYVRRRPCDHPRFGHGQVDCAVSGHRIGAGRRPVPRSTRRAAGGGARPRDRRQRPATSRSGWWLVARTKIIDDAIAEAIAHGCDRVLNLAAGLDTRPYRLDLPPDFQWIEADLPQLLAEKAELLADQTPRCQLTRSAVDLADPAARDAFFDEALDGATNALVLTEGLLMYLEDRDVTALSEALNRPEVALVDVRLRRSGTEEADEQEDGRPPAERALHFRARKWTGLLRGPGLARRRVRVSDGGRQAISAVADLHVADPVGTAAESTPPGRTTVERDGPPHATEMCHGFTTRARQIRCGSGTLWVSRRSTGAERRPITPG